jgi:hypothetical protein
MDFQEQERKQHLVNLEMFTKNAVAYNKALSIQRGDIDANGTSCWEFAETMEYLFGDDKKASPTRDNKNAIVSFTLHSENQEHCAVLMEGMVYEMCDGFMTINKYVDDAQVVKLSSILIREEIIAIDFDTFHVRKPFETAVLIANLLRLP